MEEKRLRIGLAGLLLFAALCLALPIGLSRQIHLESEGPTRIRVGPDQQIRVIAGGRLHVLAGDGSLRASYSLADFGLLSVLSDLIPLPGGDFFAAQAEPPSVWRCNEQSRSCKPILQPDEYLGPNAAALFLAWDETGGRLAVADNFEHRLLLLDGEGKLLDISSPKTLPFSFPQKLRWLGRGELAVVDTSRTRIVGVFLDQDRFGPVAWSDSAALAGPAAAYRATRWLDRGPDGSWWTLNSRPEFDGTRVVKIAPGAGPPQGFEVPTEEELADLAWFEGRLLLTDVGGWRVRSLDGTGKPGADFGDAAFRAALLAGAERQAFWVWFRRLSQVGTIGALLATIGLAWKLGRLQTANAKVSAVPQRQPEIRTPVASVPARSVRLELANDYDYVLNGIRAERSRSGLRILPALMWLWALYSGFSLLASHTPLQTLTTASGLLNLGLFLAAVLVALGLSAPFHALVMLQGRSRAVAQPARWKVDATGLDVTVGEALAGRWTWEALHGVDHLPEGFLMLQSERVMNWFPLGSFATAEESALFEAWAREKAPRYRSIRRLPLLEWLLSLLTAPIPIALAAACAETWKAATPWTENFSAVWASMSGWFPLILVWNTLVGVPLFFFLGRWTAKPAAFLLGGLSLGAALYWFCSASGWLTPNPAFAAAYPLAGAIHWLWIFYGKPR